MVTEQLVLIVEDARGIRTWQTMLSIVSYCICRSVIRLVVKITSVKGPLEGIGFFKAVKTLLYRYPNATIIAAPDTDRYGSKESAKENLIRELRRYGCKEISRIRVLPVVEKLEDVVYSLLEGKPCNCCGPKKLSQLINDKYEKHMMGNRIPRLLESNRDKICGNLSKDWILRSTGLDGLVPLICK